MSGPLDSGVLALAAMLESLGSPYAIVGGIAIVLRVRSRTTADLDAVVALGEGGLPALLARARARGYELARGSEDLAAAGLVRLTPAPGHPPGLPADLIVSDDPFLDGVLARATVVTVQGQPLRVATAEDLLLLKLEANRPHDIDDALALVDALGDGLDRAYLERWADALGIADRLRAAVSRDS